VYRDHDWSVWKFRRPPATYWRKAKANGDLSQFVSLSFTHMHTLVDSNQIFMMVLKGYQAGGTR
jgi:hypothetical protein